MNLTGKRRKAEDRVKALWAHYNEYGILLLADFKRITGGQLRPIMDTFATYGLVAPPVYDSRLEKNRRKAKALTDEAARLGQDHLTISQVATVLRIKPSRVIGVESQLLKAGFSFPEIIADGKPVETTGYRESREYTEVPGAINGSCNSMYYPAGLQVLYCFPGPGPDQITYHLR